MVGKTKPATKAEKARLQKLHDLPCLCCQMRGIDQPSRTTAHHLLSGGKRRGHMFSLNLCEWHHYARTLPKWVDKEMTAAYGPSLALSSRAFHEAFGTDDELLARVNSLILPTPAVAALTN